MARVPIAVLLLVASSPLVAIADPVRDRDSSALAEFLFNGMREHRARIRQGVVRSKGRLSKDTGEDRLEGPVELLCAFDLDKNLLRFDRTQPHRTIRVKLGRGAEQVAVLEALKSGDVKTETSRTAYFRVSDHSVHYHDVSSQVLICRPAKGPEKLSEAFDVRAAGLLLRNSIAAGTRFEEILDGLFKSPPDEIIDEGMGNYRVRWLLATGQHRRTMWIDSSRGFAATRFEVQDRRVPAGAVHPDGWPAPYLVNQVEWTEIEGIWVPTKFKLIQGTSNVFEHEFTWELINRPLPRELFSIVGLGCPKGTSIYSRLGQHDILEGQVGVQEVPLAERATEFFKPRGEFSDRLAVAQAQARQWNLRVLIVLGDATTQASQQFIQLREQDLTLAPAFAHYIVMPVGAHDSTVLAALHKAYGPAVAALVTPALVVLDAEGSLIATKSSVIEGKDRVAEADDLLNFLESHSPSYPDAKEQLADALHRAQQEDKKVFLHLSGPFCAPCRLLSRYIEVNQHVFNEHYVVLSIDGRFVHAENIIDRFRKVGQGGIPWIAILDAEANVLATSDGPEGNIGFPSQPKGIDHFMAMLATTAPRLTANQLANLRDGLERKQDTRVEK